MSSAGGCPSRQKMVSVGTSIVPPGPRPPPEDTPGSSTAVTTPQVKASLHDFAVSLGPGAGPNATPGSPSDTRPPSSYQGRVPIGPSVCAHADTGVVKSALQPRAV